jgi:hypothetical protein
MTSQTLLIGLADPTEYGDIRRRCVAEYMRVLKAVDTLNGQFQSFKVQGRRRAGDYETLSTGVKALRDLTITWWRVLMQQYGATMYLTFFLFWIFLLEGDAVLLIRCTA